MKFGISCEKKDLAQLVIQGQKTITRRDKPQQSGAIHNLIDSNGDKLGSIKIIKCLDDERWCEENIPKEIKNEIKREGYDNWKNLWIDLEMFYPDRPVLYRIEFRFIGCKL